LDRSCPAILRQERSVEVDVAVLGQSQHPGRHQAAVSHDDDGIWLDFLQQPPKFSIVLDFFRLLNCQAVALCGVLYRRCGELESAPLRPVRLCDNQRNLMTVLEQRFEGGNRELRSTAEDKLHVWMLLLATATPSFCHGEALVGRMDLRESIDFGLGL